MQTVKVCWRFRVTVPSRRVAIDLSVQRDFALLQRWNCNVLYKKAVESVHWIMAQNVVRHVFNACMKQQHLYYLRYQCLETYSIVLWFLCDLSYTAYTCFERICLLLAYVYYMITAVVLCLCHSLLSMLVWHIFTFEAFCLGKASREHANSDCRRANSDPPLWLCTCFRKDPQWLCIVSVHLCSCYTKNINVLIPFFNLAVSCNLSHYYI